jgi:hypothetical protein
MTLVEALILVVAFGILFLTGGLFLAGESAVASTLLAGFALGVLLTSIAIVLLPALGVTRSKNRP